MREWRRAGSPADGIRGGLVATAKAALATGLVAGLITLGAAPAGAAAGDAPGARATDSTLQALASVPTGWTGSSTTCSPGTESAPSLQATLDALNLLRAAAGVPPVTFDPQLNSAALSAALMMNAAGDLSHYPEPSWPCFTQLGADAARHSNLFLGRTGAAAMLGYVLDDGVTSLGHRRWALDPALTVMGSGSTNRTNALWVIDGGSQRPVAADSVVAWPPPGWITTDWVPVQWSVSLGDGQWDIATGPRIIGTPTVTVTMDGQPLSTSPATVLEPGFGTGLTIKWAPTIPDNIADSGDHVLRVTISGLQLRTGTDPATYRDFPVSYDVGVTAAPGPTGGTGSGGGSRESLQVSVAAVKNASRLWVDLNPDTCKGRLKFKVLRQRADGSWAKVGSYRTKGRSHRRTINLKGGVYAVIVPAQRGYGPAESSAVTLQR